MKRRTAAAFRGVTTFIRSRGGETLMNELMIERINEEEDGPL